MASSAVQHGRRSGKKRQVPQKEFVFGESQADLRNVTVLTGEDWTRITGQLSKKEIEADARRQAKKEKEELKQKSREMIKDWDNTLLGTRQKKLDERAKRLAKEEEEKKAQDVEEARLAAERRKEVLEKAKVQQYYQTDRVKNFHSALRTTEVLKEREAQLELNRLKAKANDGQDQMYMEIWQKEFEEGIRRDQEEAAERIRRRRECAAYQLEQARQHQAEQQQEQQQEQQEGAELRRLAVSNALEQKRLEQIGRQEQRELMRDNLKQISDVRRMQEVQRLMDEEEEEECRVFAAAKKKMMRLRAEKERQIHEEKQRNLEKIKAGLAAELAAKKNDEEARLHNAVQEREEKLENEEEEKRLERQRVQESISEHREQQRQRREAEAEEKRQRDLEMLRVRKEADRLFQEKERHRSKAKLQDERQLSEYLSRQTLERRRQEELARQEELQYEEANQQLLLQEEEQFQSYAARVIEHCERGGRNTRPLRRAATAGAGGGLGPQFPGKGGVRPSYQTADRRALQLPRYGGPSTEEVKATQHGGQTAGTGRNLGMVW